MKIDREDIDGINRALREGYHLRACMHDSTYLRHVRIFDPNINDVKKGTKGFSFDHDINPSLEYASQSYLEGGKRVHPIWMSTDLVHADQSLEDRWLTGGNSFRSNFDEEFHIIGDDFRDEEIFRVHGIDFYDALCQMREELSRGDCFEMAWNKIPDLMKNSLQGPQF